MSFSFFQDPSFFFSTFYVTHTPRKLSEHKNAEKGIEEREKKTRPMSDCYSNIADTQINVFQEIK